MIKKYSKLLLALICCFIGINSVFAREMTLDELEQELKKISPRASYIYVIGEYAFSSTHTFTREDNLLAARSIVVNDKDGVTNEHPIYNEMTIFHYDRTVGADGRPNGLKYVTNLVGTSKAPSKLNIKYIDYVFIPEVSKAEVKEAGKSDYDKIEQEFGIKFENDSHLKYNKVDDNNISLSGEIYEDKTIGENVFPKEDLTGFYYAYVVKVENLTDDSVVTIEGTKKETYTKDDFDANGEMVVLMPLHPEVVNAEKNIKVTVDLDGTGKEYAATEYKIDYQDIEFKRTLDVNATLEENMDKVSNDKVSSTLENGVLSIEQNGVVDSLSSTTGKALASALKEMLKTDGVDSVKLTYDNKDYVLTEDNVDSQVAEILAAVAEKDYNTALQNDVIGKSIKMTVELEDGNITTVTPDGKSSVEYTIDFTGTKAKPSEATLIVDDLHDAYTDAVKTFLENIKFDGLNTDLILKDGKLTGTILKNENVGNEFSSLPEDITGYYFTYVLELKDLPTDATTITVPGNGSTKVVTKDSFDTEKAIVFVTALHPDYDNKVIEIVVDLDGDGNKYLPTTYTIDYSGVQFIETIEDYFELASENTDKLTVYRNTSVLTTIAKTGESAIATLVSDIDETTNVIKGTDTFNMDGEESKMYIYETIKDGLKYVYESEDNVNWEYVTQEFKPVDEGSIINIFDGYSSVERVTSDVSGSIKLKVVIPKELLNLDDIVKPEDNPTFVPENDANLFVYIKDGYLYRIDVDYLPVFGTTISNNFSKLEYTTSVEKLDGPITIPENVVKNAKLKVTN